MEEEEVVMMTVMMETQRAMDERNNLKVPHTHTHTHYSYVTYRQLCEWEVLNRQYLVGYGGEVHY